MARSIVAIVVSYIVLMAVFFITLTLLYLALGPERVFEAGTFKITTLWITLALAGAWGAGELGGFLCHAISRSIRAAQVLAVIVIALSLLMCLPSMMADQTPKPRAADLPAMEAMQQGQAPIWMHLVSAAFFGGGVILGARLREKLTRPATAR